MQNDLEPEATVRAIGVTAWIRSFPARRRHHRRRLDPAPFGSNRQALADERRTGLRSLAGDGEGPVDVATGPSASRPGTPISPGGMGPRRQILHALFRRMCIVTTPFFVGIEEIRTVATRGSVACRLVPDCTVDAYLDERAVA